MSKIEIRTICLIIPLFFAFFLYSADIQAQDLSTGDMKIAPANAKEISRQYLDEKGKMVSSTRLFLSQNGIENEKPQADGESENVDLRGIWDTVGGCESAAARGDTVYFGDDSTLVKVDFTNPPLPVKIEEITVGGLIKDIALNGNYAYVVVDNNGLHVIDISDPDTLFETDFLSTDGASGVAVNDDFAYVADVNSGLRVIDVSDPYRLVEVGLFGTNGYAIEVVVRGDYAYVADGLEGLRVIDISNPDSLYEAGFFDTGDYPCYACGVALDGNFAYVAYFECGLRVIDISVPDSLKEVGFIMTADRAWDVALDGNFAYVADRSGGLRVIEITDPENPFEAGYYDTSDEAMAISLSDDNIFAAMAGSGIYLFYTHLVPTLVQEYSAVFSNETIKVEWKLSEAVDISEFAVYRGQFPEGNLERIQPLKIKVYDLIYTFEDADCRAGETYFYRVGIEDGNCYKILFETERISIPQVPFALHQSYPNPFNPSTTIVYDLPERGKVTLDIYDAAGRFVKCLVDRAQNGGSNKSVVWNGKDMAGNPVCSGVYFCRLRFGRKELSRKMILLK
ncbi:MAG: T9SS type A sorting domain-containing protein [Candidatus Krumholzibacteriota bacterium]|nr:T9SS type A sorting domain-containing protein [Candidatus Krumholzibacteriota bacterium]